MTRSQYLKLAFFLAMTIAGFWLGGFTGGIFAGTGGTFVVFATVGKILYYKAQRRSDKRIKDLITGAHDDE